MGCGHTLNYRCHIKLEPGEVCKNHRQQAEGPVCSGYLKTLAKAGPPPGDLPGLPEDIAGRLPPNIRPVFARYLRTISLGDAMGLMAARAFAMVEQKDQEGGDVAEMLRVAGDFAERAARVQLLMRESAPPGEGMDAYDYSQLTAEECESLERLLKKARIPEPGEPTSAQLVASSAPAPVEAEDPVVTVVDTAEPEKAPEPEKVPEPEKAP